MIHFMEKYPRFSLLMLVVSTLELQYLVAKAARLF